MKILSLFDGISCGQVALERAGIKIDKYFSSEIDKYAIMITKRNYPETIQLGDIREIEGKNFMDIDLILGGSPCQSFSTFGDKSGFKGKSGLFYDFVRILKKVKPKFFLFENVRMRKEWRDIITRELGVEPIEINSLEFSAQNRRRLYWTNIPQSRWIVNDVKLSEVLEDLPFREIPKCFFTRWGDKKRIEKGLNWIKNNKANCLTTKNCHTIQYLLNEDKTKIRLLTIQEFEKLQTLPLGYTDGIPNGERFKCIGNGWTIDVIAHIFKGLNETIGGSQ